MTLVAMYGEKPDNVAAFISDLQEIMTAGVGRCFTPYSLDQIHSTIIGLEGVTSDDGGVLNRNYEDLRNERRKIDFAEVARLLGVVERSPFRVRIGGYREDCEYGFTSRGSHPFFRSFSVQPPIAVTVGWPDGNELDEVRRGFQSANVLHKYHADPAARDNDLYLVIGQVRQVTEDELAHAGVLRKARDYLVDHPLQLEIGPADLSIVTYGDPTLPPATSRSLPINLPADEIEALYRPIGR